MASIIKLKRSSSALAVPGSLETGEIAVNLFDRRLYVGNGAGVTAVGGEVFKLTTDEPTTAGSGAYIKLLGETVPTTNSILLAAGTDLDITKNANGSITFALEETISSNTTGTAATADALTTARAIQLSGDVTGTANFDGSAGINITTTIAADSVALGTDTTGNYLETAAAGNSSIVISGVGSEGATATISLGDNIGANTSGNAATASQLATARAIQISGDVAGTANFDGSAGINIAVTQQNDSVDLGTHTTGNYVQDISGTANEITVSGSGSESASVTIGLPDDVTVAGQLNVSENIVASGNTSVGGNLSVTGDATIDGNLTVEGAVTYISSSTVNVDDSMLKLSANNAADTVDTGVYGKYVVSGNSAIQYAGYFRDAGDGVFKFYTGLDVEPTTTVDTGDTGYALAQLDAIIDGGTY